MEVLGQSAQTTTPRPYMHLGYLAATSRGISWIPLIPAIILMVFGIGQLCLQKKRSRIAGGAAIILSLLLLWMSVAFYFSKPRIYKYTSIRSQVNLHRLSIALELYAQENDGKLPDLDQWCELLAIKYVDMDLKPFSLGDLDAECAYAINEKLGGLKLDDIPADVVLLFETDLGIEQERTGSILSRPFAEQLGYTKDAEVFPNRWNQVGGPEDIKLDYHQVPGLCVLFGDGDSEFIAAEDIENLRWKVEDVEKPMEVVQQ